MAVPLCQYYSRCQGCSLQYVEYAQQLENKQRRVCTAVGLSTIEVFSAESYHYRNRLELFWNGTSLCLRGEKGKLIPVARCVIAEEKINVLIAEINAFFVGKGEFQGVVLRTTTTASSISFVRADVSEKFMKEVQPFTLQSAADNIIVTCTDDFYGSEYSVVKGNDYLKEEIMGKQFIFPVQGFFQNNTKMMLKMQEYVQSLLQKYPTHKAELLDLYSGVGTFGIINAELFQKVTLVENFKPAIEMAQKNLEWNEIKNGKAFVLAGGQIGRLKFSSLLYVIADPPRVGMEEKAIIELNRLKPEVIVYISCNLEQLKKDLPKFKSYKVKSAALFDLFPQTNHMEVVVELVRESTFSK